MKIFRDIAVALVLLAVFGSQSVDAQTQILVKLKNSSESLLDISRLSAKKNIDRTTLSNAELFTEVTEVKRTFPLLDEDESRLGKVFSLSLEIGSDAEEVLNRWQGRNDVEYVQINRKSQVDSSPSILTDDINDSLKDSLFHMNVIRAYEAWDISNGSGDVVIGIVDTGVMADHPDLVNQFWINPGEDLNQNGQIDAGDFDGLDNDGNGFVDDISGYDFVDWDVSLLEGDYTERDPDASPDNHIGRPGQTTHGTEMAGTAAAQSNNSIGIAGVAPGCKIISLRAFGGNGSGEDDDTAAAIIYGADIGADVLNLSFGDSYYAPIVRDAIIYAVTKGVVLVASAGNDGSQEAHYPSDYPEVIGVAWLNEAGEKLGSLAARGVGIDVGAPGSRVFTTTLPRPDNDGVISFADTMIYRKVSGSSISTPQVAAAAALLKSVDPELTPDAIKGILKSTAIDLSIFGNTRFAGSGRIDIAAALGVPYPTNVEINSPDRDGALADGQIDIIGSVVAPLFLDYTLEYGRLRNAIDSVETWIPIVSNSKSQVREGSLGSLDTSSLEAGGYVLRLTANLNTGQILQDWRRVYLYREPPQLTIHQFDRALVDGSWGILAEVSSDDVMLSEVDIELGGQIFTVNSDRISRRQKVVWPNEFDSYGLANVSLKSTNVSGLTTTHGPFQIEIPRRVTNLGSFTESITSMPAGRMVPQSMDLDRDDLKEVFFNRYNNLSVSDSLFHYEWDGSQFVKNVGTGFAINGRPVIPQAVGDSDGDGSQEILLQALPTQNIPLWLLWEYRRGFDRFFLAFPDTTADSDLIIDPDSVIIAFGADFMDLDQDGNTEILTHNTTDWTVVEHEGGAYTKVARLANPTSIEESRRSDQLGVEASNALGQAKALIDDLDGDGRMDVLSMDSDADFMVHENTGDNQYEVAWTYETGRYGIAGSRFASGDFDGDGLNEFVTYTSNFSARRSDREYDAAFGLYYHFEARGDNDYVLVDSLALDGNIFTSGSLNSADLDNDGREELVLVHPPNLYILKADEMGLFPIFHRGSLMTGTPDGIVSVSTVIDDFDNDGNLEILTNSADERIHRFEYDAVNSQRPIPLWVSGIVTGDNQITLTWQANDDLAVKIYRGLPGEALELLAEVTDANSYQVSTNESYEYALASVNQTGEMSPISERRLVVYESIPQVVEVRYPDSDVQLVFDAPIDQLVKTTSFIVDNRNADRVIVSGGGKFVNVYFDPRLKGSQILEIRSLKSRVGTAVADTSIVLNLPESIDDNLYLLSWETVDGITAKLIFNKALDPSFAVDVNNYRIDPSGTVASVDHDNSNPSEVIVHLENRFIGPTGLQTTLVVLDMQAVDGSVLAGEGNVAALAGFADRLDDVFVFPNPYKEAEVSQPLIVAGLPRTATITIFSLDGLPVRVLEELDGNGGLAWDLNDSNGKEVPSGVYILKVESGDLEPVLVKAAIVR